MIKVIGVVIVILASWGYGSGLIGRLNQHKKQLFSLQELIDLFLGEIQYGKQPLQEVCAQIGQRMQSPFKEILFSVKEELALNRFQSFEMVWKEQCQHYKKELLLTEAENQVLYGLGKNLGYLDADAQVRHLHLYKREVENLLEQLEQSSKEKKKVYRSVSLMVGAMVILLFI